MNEFRWWLFQRLFWIIWVVCPLRHRIAFGYVVQHGRGHVSEILAGGAVIYG